MREFLYHDYVLNCSYCNLKCEYCLSLEEGRKLGECTEDDGKDGNINVEETLNTLMKLYEEIPAPILKISGGELFFFKNIIELLEELAKVYTHVQVLTNGVLLTRKMINRLACHKNIGLNLSMDGHTLAMNSCRFKSEKLNRNLLDALTYTIETIGHAEITSVMTNANADDFESFLEYLETLLGKVVAFPIPVRGNGVQSLFSIEKRKLFASRLVDMAKRHANVTGPVIYYEKLAAFLREDTILRYDRCFIPKLAIQLFDTGVISPCPLVWTDSLGNINDPERNRLMKNIDSHRIYNILTHKRHKLDICKDCYAQTDLINLYLMDQLSLDELKEVPMFHDEKIVASLERIYKELDR